MGYSDRHSQCDKSRFFTWLSRSQGIKSCQSVLRKNRTLMGISIDNNRAHEADHYFACPLSTQPRKIHHNAIPVKDRDCGLGVAVRPSSTVTSLVTKMFVRSCSLDTPDPIKRDSLPLLSLLSSLYLTLALTGDFGS